LSAVTSTPRTLNLSANPWLMKLASEQPTYACDTTAFVVVYPEAKYESLYATYGTIGSLAAAVDAVPGVQVQAQYDTNYSFGYLESASGLIGPAAPGTYVHFSTSNPVALFQIYFEMSSPRYAVDTTALNLYWETGLTTVKKRLSYDDYPSVLAMKNVINTITGFDASGNISYNTHATYALKLASGSFPPDATFYPGLKPCYVQYQTISERRLSDRTNFDIPREATVSERIVYLDSTREPQIRQYIDSEALLREPADGGNGDLYVWANNRFNRRQGCEARLKQIEKQTEANQSALQINRSVA